MDNILNALKLKNVGHKSGQNGSDDENIFNDDPPKDLPKKRKPKKIILNPKNISSTPKKYAKRSLNNCKPKDMPKGYTDKFVSFKEESKE